jgi:serine protease Do
MRGLVNSAEATRSSGPPMISEQVGTGLIVTPEGHIVTNKHVVDNAYHVEVTLYDGTHVHAHVVAVARNFDLAVLKIDKTGLTPITMGNSDQVKVGETVVAIGNPLGLKETVSVGVVSAVHRNIGFSDFDDLIQTDAAINPGNSGGPLFNSVGEVIGINQAIYTIGNGKGSIGLGFAISINEARYMIDHLRTTSTTDQGFLGVSIQRLTPDLAAASSSTSIKGVLVTEVLPGTAAFDAGIQEGDIIRKLGGEIIDDTDDLNRIVAASANVTKNLSYERDGKEITVPVFITESLEPTIIQGQLAPPQIKSLKDAGLEVRASEKGGVIVSSVAENTVADVTGFKVGDQVLVIRKAKITNISEFESAIAAEIEQKTAGVRVLLSGQKGRRWVYLALGE